MTIHVLPALADTQVLVGRDTHSLLTAAQVSGTLSDAPDSAQRAFQATGRVMAKDDDALPQGLPSGLVTFVFTDIEASTRLYKLLGDEIAGDVFDLHNIHMRAAWDAHNGHEVHTEGDSFFVVFEDPNDAIAACLDVQRRMAATAWPGDAEVRVRIGIHCGLAAPRNDDYMALAVHQAARVMSAANGAQILVTDTILQRLGPLQDATVVRAGRYRLRDFDDVPTLFRIDCAKLEPNEAPPRATPASHHNLVPRLTSFVGRDRDVAAVRGLLEPATAVTLAGLGGMGKTRLATEVGLQVAPSWEAGVWMVELAEVADSELIAEEVAATIGVDSTSAGDRWDDVLDFIGDKEMLLILDNVEHLVEPVASLVPRLLRACPNAGILSTTREPLNCQGETVYRLDPLDVSVNASTACAAPSVELFMDRAQAVVSGFTCDGDQLIEVLEICRDLDGLPLAIEIAAAQVGVLQLGEIRSGLNNRFRLLRSRDRALPARQRTMEGLLGWSYQLLTETEKRAFRRLAVFGGSFSKETAEAALAGHGIAADDVPELIWALVDKSLVTADLSDSATRYRLLDSVQQYAMRLLIDNDDPVRVAVQIAECLLKRVAPWLPIDRNWLGNVAIDLANVRNVVNLMGDASPEIAQQLMCSVGRYRDRTQSYHAGIEELTWAAERLTAETPARVALLAELADLHLRRGETTKASTILSEADAIQRRSGPPEWNDVAVARSLGEIAIRDERYADAIALAETGLAGSPSDRGAARMWNLLGIAKSATGDLAGALQAGENELRAYEALGEIAYIASARGNLAETAWRLGNEAAAARHQEASLDQAVILGQHVIVAYSLIMAARLLAAKGDWQEAIELQTSAEHALHAAGHQLYNEDLDAATALHTDAVQALGEAIVRQAQVAGRDLSLLEGARRAKLGFSMILATAQSDSTANPDRTSF